MSIWLSWEFSKEETLGHKAKLVKTGFISAVMKKESQFVSNTRTHCVLKEERTT